MFANADDAFTALTVLLYMALILITILSTGNVYKAGLYLHVLDVAFLLGLIVVAYVSNWSYNQESASTSTAKYAIIIIFITTLFYLL